MACRAKGVLLVVARLGAAGLRGGGHYGGLCGQAGVGTHKVASLELVGALQYHFLYICYQYISELYHNYLSIVDNVQVHDIYFAYDPL